MHKVVCAHAPNNRELKKSVCKTCFTHESHEQCKIVLLTEYTSINFGYRCTMLASYVLTHFCLFYVFTSCLPDNFSFQAKGIKPMAADISCVTGPVNRSSFRFTVLWTKKENVFDRGTLVWKLLYRLRTPVFVRHRVLISRIFMS